MLVALVPMRARRQHHPHWQQESIAADEEQSADELPRDLDRRHPARTVRRRSIRSSMNPGPYKAMFGGAVMPQPRRRPDLVPQLRPARSACPVHEQDRASVVTAATRTIRTSAFGRRQELSA
jgi:hypothetical protein